MNQDQIKHTIIEYITLNPSLTDYKLNSLYIQNRNFKASHADTYKYAHPLVFHG